MTLREKLHEKIDEFVDNMDEQMVMEHEGDLHIINDVNDLSDIAKQQQYEKRGIAVHNLITIRF